MNKNLIRFVLPTALAVFACAPSFAFAPATSALTADDTKADKVEKADKAAAKADKADAKAINQDAKVNTKAHKKASKARTKADQQIAKNDAKARKADEKEAAAAAAVPK